MKTAVETIDAAKAKKYLEHNIPFSYDNTHTNRPVSWNTIRIYARDMLLGNWQLTHQGIAFGDDENSTLLDGQQRLMALVLASEEGVFDLEANPKVSFETYVTRGAPRLNFEFIDTGRNRTGMQVLAMSGIRNSAVIASACRMLYLFDHAETYRDWFGTKLTVHDIRRIAEETGIVDYGSDGASLQMIGMIPSAGVAASYIAHRALPDGPHSEFLDALKTGLDSSLSVNDAISENEDDDERKPNTLEFDDPRRILREFLIRSRATGGKVRRDTHKHLFVFIKAWNDFVKGRKRHVIAWQEREGIIRPVGWSEEE